MINTLILKTAEGSGLNANMSSLLHGFIMENIDSSFADEIHISEIRKYSQYLRKRGGSYEWVINTLDDRTRENIIDRIKDIKEIYLKSKELHIDIVSSELRTTSFDELFNKNYYIGKEQERYIKLGFVSPAAFKSNGMYINYPDIRMLFSSIIRKYDAVSEHTSIYDENMFDALLNSVKVVGYDLRSTRFYLESISIPAFMGKIKIKINGNANMVSFVHMLTDFAEFSGIGIKSAIGMGAVIKERNEGQTVRKPEF